MTDTKLPTFFIPHGGGPCFFMDWNPADAWDRTANYLRSIPKLLKQKPKALVVISAHWEEAEFTILTKPNPDLYFDYYGFPPHTYELEYRAPNSPQVISRVRELLSGAGIKLNEDIARDFDHGIFIPLKVAFPDADIPIVQISLKKGLNPAEHLALGKALEPLRYEGVAIIGSGMTYHNLPVLMASMSGKAPPNQSQEFDDFLSSVVTNPDPVKRASLLNEWDKGAGARNAHPRAEHLLPLMVVVGAADTDVGHHDFSDTVMGAVISAYRFS